MQGRVVLSVCVCVCVCVCVFALFVHAVMHLALLRLVGRTEDFAQAVIKVCHAWDCCLLQVSLFAPHFFCSVCMCQTHTHTPTPTHTHTQTDRQTDRQTQTHRHTHTHREIDRQTDTHTHTHTHTTPLLLWAFSGVPWCGHQTRGPQPWREPSHHRARRVTRAIRGEAKRRAHHRRHTA